MQYKCNSALAKVDTRAMVKNINMQYLPKNVINKDPFPKGSNFHPIASHAFRIMNGCF